MTMNFPILLSNFDFQFHFREGTRQRLQQPLLDHTSARQPVCWRQVCPSAGDVQVEEGGHHQGRADPALPSDRTFARAVRRDHRLHSDPHQRTLRVQQVSAPSASSFPFHKW